MWNIVWVSPQGQRSVSVRHQQWNLLHHIRVIFFYVTLTKWSASLYFFASHIRKVVTAKLLMQCMSTSPAQCCYFTLQNKILALGLWQPAKRNVSLQLPFIVFRLSLDRSAGSGACRLVETKQVRFKCCLKVGRLCINEAGVRQRAIETVPYGLLWLGRDFSFSFSSGLRLLCLELFTHWRLFMPKPFFFQTTFQNSPL